MTTNPIQAEISPSPIVLGTWQAGKRYWAGIDERDILQALQTALDVGINTFDTAEVYGDGLAETLLGKAIGSARNRAVYFSKVFANHLRHDQVVEACHGSLQRLGTDYLDVYFIHWPAGSWDSPEVPIEETMNALNDLKKQGKIRGIGVSNFSLPQLQEARQFGTIDYLQPPYSLFWRHIEGDLLPYCQNNGIGVVAYSSLAHGLLTGKFGSGHRFPKEDNRSKAVLCQPGHYERVQQALPLLKELASNKNTTMPRLALAWSIHQPNVFPIAGARNAAQVQDLAGAMALQLTTSDLECLDQISRLVTNHLDDNIVMWNF